MPHKENPTRGYDWNLTPREHHEVTEWSPPKPWNQTHTVASGFVMFDNDGAMGNFREAGIGPTDDGEVRVYLSTEQIDGSWDNEERFEGDFETAFSRLKSWLQKYD